MSEFGAHEVLPHMAGAQRAARRLALPMLGRRQCTAVPVPRFNLQVRSNECPLLLQAKVSMGSNPAQSPTSSQPDPLRTALPHDFISTGIDALHACHLQFGLRLGQGAARMK